MRLYHLLCGLALVLCGKHAIGGIGPSRPRASISSAWDFSDESLSSHVESDSGKGKAAFQTDGLDSDVASGRPKERRRRLRLRRPRPSRRPVDSNDVFGQLSLEQLELPIFYNRTEGTHRIASPPPAQVRIAFAQVMIGWLASMNYPEVPSQRMFARREQWTITARWGNDVSESAKDQDPSRAPRQWPADQSKAHMVLVVKDDVLPDWEDALLFKQWIHRHVQTDYGLEAFLLLVPLADLHDYGSSGPGFEEAEPHVVRRVDERRNERLERRCLAMDSKGIFSIRFDPSSIRALEIMDLYSFHFISFKLMVTQLLSLLPGKNLASGLMAELKSPGKFGSRDGFNAGTCRLFHRGPDQVSLPESNAQFKSQLE
ncbi:MAG: hypothetical protein M1831_002015 [Alyxoria varia]|nr:MAG: hypothetical protein M1831_002015 [Alyxoria varia]